MIYNAVGNDASVQPFGENEMTKLYVGGDGPVKNSPTKPTKTPKPPKK